MEVTLKGLYSCPEQQERTVSILVLMEVTLKVVFGGLALGLRKRFNPCFNGSDSKRSPLSFSPRSSSVSILVLMEVTLKAKAVEGGSTDTAVSILVLMEVTLKDVNPNAPLGNICFNPCFNGSDSKS